EPLHRLQQAVDGHGLGEESGDSHLRGRGSNVRMRTEKDDGNVLDRGIPLLLGSELPAVHRRHHHVEEDEAGPDRSVAELLECFHAVRRGNGFVFGIGQHLGDGVANLAIVLHHQHGAVATRRGHARARSWSSATSIRRTNTAGRSMTNVEPRPTWLLTSMVPPCASTMCFAMYNPRPSPP